MTAFILWLFTAAPAAAVAVAEAIPVLLNVPERHCAYGMCDTPYDGAWK